MSIIESILADALEGEKLSQDEIQILLELEDQEDIRLLFCVARSRRRRYFGDTIFLYGFIYFSTFCRNNCKFCHFRRSNSTLPRYRKKPEEVIDAACEMAEAGVHLIDLTMGEDPHYHCRPHGFDDLIQLVTSIRTATGLPVMVSPGVVPSTVLADLAQAGATWYACYQEIYDRPLFEQLRPGQSYDQRLCGKRAAHGLGMLTEEGLLCGIGESAKITASSIAAIRALDPEQVRVMGFVPQAGTPMEHNAGSDPSRELITMAVMRLIFPDKLIPASLDVDGLAGLEQRLNAGANVITSLVLPGNGLAGVANRTLDIEEARRTPASVLPILNRCKLRAGTKEEYLAWIRKGEKKLCNRESMEMAI